MFGRSRSTSGSTKYLSTLAMAFALVMGIVCFSSCGKPDEPKPTPTPVNPVKPDPPTPPEDKDTKAPEITLNLGEINVYGGKAVTIEAGKLSIGETEVATWTDDKSAADKCTVVLSFTEAGTKATTEATTQAETGTDNAPDTKAETKAGTTIKSGDTLDKAGTLTITVSDEAGNKAEKGINLTDQILFGLESLSSLDLQIDKEVNLIGGLSFYPGWSLTKVEIETNGSRTEVTDPEHYIPVVAGSIYVIITVTDGAKTAEFKSDALSVKPISYNAVIPAKAESMYQKFNTTDDRAFKRRGAYETKALAQSLKNRNACKVLIFHEGVYTQGETDIHEWRGGAGDGHGEKVYRNIKEGSGDTNDILATRGTRIDVKNNINNSSLKGGHGKRCPFDKSLRFQYSHHACTFSMVRQNIRFSRGYYSTG